MAALISFFKKCPNSKYDTTLVLQNLLLPLIICEWNFSWIHYFGVMIFLSFWGPCIAWKGYFNKRLFKNKVCICHRQLLKPNKFMSYYWFSLGLPGLSWARLDLPDLEWAGLSWLWLGWADQGWPELARAALNWPLLAWAGLKCLILSHYTSILKVSLSCLSSPELAWGCQNWNGMFWAGLGWYGLAWAGLA